MRYGHENHKIIQSMKKKQPFVNRTSPENQTFIEC